MIPSMPVRPAPLTPTGPLGAGLLVVGITVFAGCATSDLFGPTREQVLKGILASSVQVILENQEGRRFRSGSGVAIAVRPGSAGTNCFVLTSGHTFSGEAKRTETYVVLGRHEGALTKVRATVLAHRDTEDLDLALLSVRTDRCFAARPGRPPDLGEPVWVASFPWGRGMTLSRGIVSQIQINEPAPADPETGSRLMVDASVSYGASGGGVFDGRTGGLVGLVEGYRTARVSAQGAPSPWYVDVPVPGQTFVTPLVDIRRFLEETGYAGLLRSPAGRPRWS
jgi:hypothetical protein